MTQGQHSSSSPSGGVPVPRKPNAPKGTIRTVRRPGGNVNQAARPTPLRPPSGGIWQVYTGDDSPGIKMGPIPVLIISVVFIALVFLLHIYGKYLR